MIEPEALILIVDDMPINLQLLSRLLEMQGYRYLSAQSGAEALDLARAQSPDLILLDIMMPDMDGIETCRQLKMGPRTAEIPVIFLTALHDTDSIVKGFDAGGVDYVSKPFKEVELMMRIRNHLELKFAKEALKRDNRHLNQELVERRRFEDELIRYEKELEEKVNLDDLCQISNRRGMNEYIGEMLDRLAADQSPLAAIMCDVDHFKRYNDHYGHQQGDQCLVKVSEAIRSAKKRPIDMVARYGGEEFLVLLPHATIREGLRIAEEVAQRLIELDIPHEDTGSNTQRVTLSMGVADLWPKGVPGEADRLIEEADQALYRAKQNGRNRIEVAPIREPE
ncbi:MAG: diguanylate cyclase [bacterium]|nr:diguanylate cyclase [bacterium]